MKCNYEYTRKNKNFVGGIWPACPKNGIFNVAPKPAKIQFEILDGMNKGNLCEVIGKFDDGKLKVIVTETDGWYAGWTNEYCYESNRLKGVKVKE